MHITQTNAVDKSNGTARLLGNATHPEVGTIIDMMNGLAVAPNPNTNWDMLPDFEWASIEAFAEAVAICALWRRGRAHWPTTRI